MHLPLPPHLLSLRRVALGCVHLLLALLLLSLLLSTARATEQPLPRISAASEVDYPPYCIVDSEGAASGFAVELLRASLGAMGYEVDFALGPWSEVKQSLAAGTVQVLPLVGRTPEREAEFDFTFPYLTMHGTIVAREGETEIRTLDDLRGKTVAVMRGDNAEEFLLRSGLKVKLVTTATFGEALQQLAAGQHDAVIIQKLLFLQLAKQLGIDTLKSVGAPLEEFRQSFCFAVREGDQQLLATLNEGLSIALADGSYHQLYHRWIAPVEKSQKSLNRIVVGGDSNYPPYEYLDENGAPAGYNVELTKAVAKAAGLNIEIRLRPWHETRAGLQSGEIDLVHGMFYSPERDQFFDFSPAHTLVSYVAVTLGAARLPSNFAELAGKRVIVMDGDIMHDKLLARNDPSVAITTVETQEDALWLLNAGGHDYALISRIPALYWIDQHRWHNLRVGTQPFVSLEYCYAAKDGNDELLLKVSDALTTLKNSGAYHEIYSRSLGVYEKKSPVLVFALLTSAILMGLFLLALLWLTILRREVKKRTLSLEQQIEERKRIQTKLKRREERYRILVGTIPLGIVVMNQHGRILFVNDILAAMYRERADELIGCYSYEVFKRRPAKSPPGSAQLPQHDSSQGYVENQEVRRDGSVLYTRLRCAPFETDEGHSGTIEVIEDITEYRRIEAKTQQLARLAAIGEMASGVAHEINNPISGVINYAQLLLNFVPPEQVRERNLLERIMKEGDRIVNIVRSLLDITRKNNDEKKSLKLEDVIIDVVQVAGRQLKADGIELELDIVSDLPAILGDAQKLSQVLLNLISNARYALNKKFPGRHPEKILSITLTRRAHNHNNFLQLTVKDRGIGIAPEHHEKIFNPFFTTKPAGEGTGLGLSLSHEFLRDHGATIHHTSQPGEYTEFVVEFPIRLSVDKPLRTLT
ncbi:MAG: transporter substrate-binding domain-containing protein [Desulfuromonadales bacterium]|nr:transporter substrate-binding domain-containing protein [Desulfuromonadales bacterium]